MISDDTKTSLSIRLAMLAAAFAGCAALIYEVVATRALFYFFNESTYSVASVIAVFLMGLALGAYILSFKISRVKKKRRLFAGMQILIGIYALFILPQFEFIPGSLGFLYQTFGSGSSMFLLSKFIVSLIYLLIPTVLIGASFPLICSIVIEKLKEAGKGVSIVYFFDLVGAVLGTLAAGFILLPKYGISATYVIGGLLSFIAAILVSLEKRKIFIFVSLIALFALVLSFVVIDPFGAKGITIVKEEGGLLFEKHFEGKDILFKKNSPYGEVYVARDPEWQNDLVLFINRREQCLSSISPSEETIAHATLAPLGEELEVLNIGLGCGMTLNAVAQNPKVKQADVVEINPVIPEATRYFEEFNENVLDNEKVNLMIEDGFYYLGTADKKYDAVIMDIENPAVIHSSPLYTVEAFEKVRDVLNEKGVFGLWAYLGDFDYASTIYYSLRTSFKNVFFVKEDSYGYFLFFASNDRLDPEKLGVKGSDMTMLQQLKMNKNYQLNTLDNPVLEYLWARTRAKEKWK